MWEVVRVVVKGEREVRWQKMGRRVNDGWKLLCLMQNKKAQGWEWYDPQGMEGKERSRKE